MKRDFDFDRIGKRLPYNAPDGFLDDMENNVWETVRPVSYTHLHSHYRAWSIWMFALSTAEVSSEAR